MAFQRKVDFDWSLYSPLRYSINAGLNAKDFYWAPESVNHISSASSHYTEGEYEHNARFYFVPDANETLRIVSNFDLGFLYEDPDTRLIRVSGNFDEFNITLSRFIITPGTFHVPLFVKIRI